MYTLVVFSLLLAQSFASFGYYGNQCTGDNPCQNNGTCYENSYTNYVTGNQDTYKYCVCPREFIGQHCEIENPCTDDYCQNGGHCYPGRNATAHCACNFAYTGSQCEVYIDPCDPNPCQNNGECVAEQHYRFCNCTQGYIGQDCEELDPCDPSPCGDHGSCYPSRMYHGYYGTGANSPPPIEAACSCDFGYHGQFCENYTDPCAKDPCKHGVCDSTVASWYDELCTCDDGFVGYFCDQKESCEDANEEEWCLNNSTCHEYQTYMGHTQAYCMCPEGFQGARCDIPVCGPGEEKNGDVCEACRGNAVKPYYGDYNCYECPPGSRANADSTMCEPFPRNGTGGRPTTPRPGPPKKGGNSINLNRATTTAPPPSTAPQTVA